MTLHQPIKELCEKWKQDKDILRFVTDLLDFLQRSSKTRKYHLSEVKQMIQENLIENNETKI